MSTLKTTSTYDDGNIPEIDQPKPSNAAVPIPSELDSGKISVNEDSRPRKDGPGGN